MSEPAPETEITHLSRSMLPYADHAAACTTMAALQELAQATVGLAGMQVIACGMVTGPRGERAEPFHFQNWPAAWLELYRARAYMERDPLPRWAIVSGAASRWRDIMDQLPPNDPGHEILAALMPFGLRNGVVVPVRSNEGHLGLVSVGGPDERISPAAFSFLHSICTVTLHRAESLERIAPPRCPWR